jgi:hypothetical protein
VFDGAKGDEDGLVSWHTESGQPNPYGSVFLFAIENKPGSKATFSFKDTENSITYAEASIKGIIPMTLSLNQLRHSTKTPGEQSKNITMITTIPLDQLTTEITGPGSQITDVSIVPGYNPELQIDINNTLASTEFQIYNVSVIYDGQKMATVSVRVYGSDWYTVDGTDGFFVGPDVTFTSDLVLNDLTICPTGSSQPRSASDAIWYEKYVGAMDFTYNTIFDGDGPHQNAAGVIWWNSPVRTLAPPEGFLGAYTMASCSWNYAIISSANSVEWVLTNDIYGVFPQGQIVAAVNSDDEMHLPVTFKCVVWD